MTWYDSNFGAQKAGLGTVGYREVNNVGGDAVARTGTGVVDAGDGMYGVDVTLNAATVSLQWDTGEAVPVFAVEAINQLANLDAKIDIIDANVDLVLLDTTQLLLDVAAVKTVVDLILLDTTQLLLDVAAVKAETALILADTTQLLLDTAALNAQNVLILADTAQLLLDTLAIQAQNILILADTAALLLDTATIQAQNVLILADTTQILSDTTQLLLDTIAILADTGAILLDTDNIDTLLSDIEDGHDIREILRLIVASANNVLSGAEGGSTQIRLTKLNGTGTRQLTNVDVDGNRLSIVSRDFTP
jgi:hypothetical protein